MKAFYVLIALYLLNAITKLIWYEYKIHRGNQLIKELNKNSADKNKINQLYPSIKEYCKAVNVVAYINPYGIPTNLVNKLSPVFQNQLRDSINEAIGVYRYMRHYCYILLPVHNNKKPSTILKIFFDAFLKVAFSHIAKFLFEMLLNQMVE